MGAAGDGAMQRGDNYSPTRCILDARRYCAWSDADRRIPADENMLPKILQMIVALQPQAQLACTVLVVVWPDHDAGSGIPTVSFCMVAFE